MTTTSTDHWYFAYGSNKRGFSNYADNVDILSDFRGAGTSTKAFPLVVPNEPNCNNPNCPYLHRMASLVDAPGQGHRIEGEVFKITPAALERIDELERFSYQRGSIDIELDGTVVTAITYFIKDRERLLGELAAGRAQAVPFYTLEMGESVLKPGR